MLVTKVIPAIVLKYPQRGELIQTHRPSENLFFASVEYLRLGWLSGNSVSQSSRNHDKESGREYVSTSLPKTSSDVVCNSHGQYTGKATVLQVASGQRTPRGANHHAISACSDFRENLLPSCTERTSGVASMTDLWTVHEESDPATPLCWIYGIFM